MKPLELTEDALVFAAVLEHGVPTIPLAMDHAAGVFLRETGRSLVKVEGNFKTVSYFFDPPVDEKEVDEFTARYCR